MPYKLSGTTILVKRGSKWKVLKQHKTKQEAIKHLAALKLNIKEA